MAQETVNAGWLEDYNGTKFIPKTSVTQIVDLDERLAPLENKNVYTAITIKNENEDGVTLNPNNTNSNLLIQSMADGGITLAATDAADYIQISVDKNQVVFWDDMPEEVIIDDALDDTSTNPVENQVITEALQAMEDKINNNQSDWNEININSPSFIKNKPFQWVENGLTVVLPGTEYYDFWQDDTFNLYSFTTVATYALIANKNYRVIWDGEIYDCVSQDISALGTQFTGAIAIGNGTAFGFVGHNEPFIIVYFPLGGYNSYIALTDTEAGNSHTVHIAKFEDVVFPLSSEYLDFTQLVKTYHIHMPWEKILMFNIDDSSAGGPEATIVISCIEEFIGCPIQERTLYSVQWEEITHSCYAKERIVNDRFEIWLGDELVQDLSIPFSELLTPFFIKCYQTNSANDTWRMEISCRAPAVSSGLMTRHIIIDTPEVVEIKEENLPFGAIASYIDNYINRALGGDY